MQTHFALYDVPADGVVIGRIMKAAAAPEGTPWMWTLAYGYHGERKPTHGYEATREAAHGRVRQKLAAEMMPDLVLQKCHSDRISEIALLWRERTSIIVRSSR